MSGNSGWQTSANSVPAPGVAGDFASSNPRYTYDAGPGGLVAGTAGATVGRFAWVSYASIDADNAPATVNNFPTDGFNAPAGVIHRDQQGLNTIYLSDATMLIPQGFPVTVMNGGDFFVKNEGTTAALVGQKAYAKYSNGAVSFRATGVPTTASINGSIAAATASITGSVLGNVLTATAVTGTLVAGALLYGTVGGSGVIANTKIVAQLTGSIGLVGTYALSIGEQQVGSGTLTTSNGILTVGTLTSGTLSVGDILSGGSVTTGTTIQQLGTGTGGVGTYYVDPTQTASAAALTATSDIETRFTATSSGQANEVVKIADRYGSGVQV